MRKPKGRTDINTEESAAFSVTTTVLGIIFLALLIAVMYCAVTPDSELTAFIMKYYETIDSCFH